MIDLKFLPLEIVEARTTYDGMGYSDKRNLLTSSYKGVLPLAPGSSKTTI